MEHDKVHGRKRAPKCSERCILELISGHFGWEQSLGLFDSFFALKRLYTVSHKKQDTLLMSITSLNID